MAVGVNKDSFYHTLISRFNCILDFESKSID